MSVSSGKKWEIWFKNFEKIFGTKLTLKILALIPARGGSKRLKNKNIRLLGGIPLVNWSIASAKKIPEICDILVSTDDLLIASIARKAGALVPWIRKQELSKDDSNLIDVSLHALDWYESSHQKIDGLLLLQPTSPFRSIETIQDGIKNFKLKNDVPIIAVCEATENPHWMFKFKNHYLKPISDLKVFKIQSQELEKRYKITGSFYLVTPNFLRKHKSFIYKYNLPLFINSNIQSIDIDTEWDFEIAVFFQKKYNIQP